MDLPGPERDTWEKNASPRPSPRLAEAWQTNPNGCVRASTNNTTYNAFTGTRIQYLSNYRALCARGRTRRPLLSAPARCGEEMGRCAPNFFLPPNDLEFEKIYLRLLLKGKKRYFGWKIEPGCKRKLDIKGFECIRRDFCPYLCEIQRKSRSSFQRRTNCKKR